MQSDRTMMSPRELETVFNKAPLVRAVTAFLMVFSILAVITRIATRLFTAGSLKLDDHTVIAATALAIAQALVVILQAANGFGHHSEVLSAEEIAYILKCMYAANVLYIVTLAVTKISACMTVMNVAPLDRRRGIFSVMAVIAAWAVSAAITVLFQCQVSEPWNFASGKCVNLPAFWTYFEVLNIVTDLAIIVAISELVWNIQAQKSMKSLVLFIFGSRILIAPAAICHVIYINRAAESFSSTGDTFDFWTPVVIRQVVLCLSMTTACVPYLKPFLDNLESGQMRAGDALLYVKSGSGNSGNKSAGRKTAVHNSKAAGTTSAGASASSALGDAGTGTGTGTGTEKQYELENIVKNPKGIKTTTTIVHDDGQPSWDGQSQSSQTVLVQQSWRVDVEARPTSQA